jgi:hypothetical protein
LFASRPSELIEALAAPGKVTIYLGEYQETRDDRLTMLWVSRRDSTVQARFVEKLSMPSEVDASPIVVTEYVPFRYLPKGKRDAEKELARDQRRAKQIFTRVKDSFATTGTVFLGSPRSNLLSELLVADLFRTRPFRPVPGRPRVPFFLTYRNKDRVVSSCFGGYRNPPRRTGKLVPGVHYLDADGQWVACPWRREKEDAAVIIVIYQPHISVQLAILGFTSWGTEAIGRRLLLDAAPFWEKPLAWRGRRIGVYVCRFNTERELVRDVGEVIHARNLRVTGLDHGVLRQHMP